MDLPAFSTDDVRRSGLPADGAGACEGERSNARLQTSVRFRSQNARAIQDLREMTYRIALADDQVSMLECVRRILAGGHDLQIVAEARDGAMLLELLRAAPVVPDLIITDITMPTVGGIEATREIGALYPEAKVLILTMHPEEEYLFQALDAGAAGYMIKDDAVQELLQAIRLIRTGGTYVSACFGPQILKRARSEQDVPPRAGHDESQTHANAGDAKRASEPGDAPRPRRPPA
jgi:DNA-binding NarL/FixJ family response regulator